MIPSPIAQAQNVLNDAEVALCQRVFDHVASAKKITSDPQRQDLASRIIQSYQHGLKDEDSLLSLLIDFR
ncbi:hypothetical protein GGE45_002925 [Rhizobium aethiopicum]|uniref:Uncharacterized protein n=1 Tax=Rhizobium aethiopicum TaxID=1138170 RepID=A0A7W6Q7D6_9HYPH|nr:MULTISPECIES: hypothetical protein [Rhizobium]MBB4191358.1 hypothetical protein [Rhizobium aethiopicum]MBB4580590.1 hypothetical protein [Rhizobium aethiopicum]MDO3432887.1 hypothetical protein [Rhizobium sp. CBN3]